MWHIIFWVGFALFFIFSIIEFYIIRGFLITSKTPRKHKHLTGIEIEELRRKISMVGINAITVDDVLNLIKTIRDTHLGTYIDEDPYVPADPYDDIDIKQ